MNKESFLMTIPEDWKVKELAVKKGFVNVQEFVRSLIRDAVLNDRVVK